MAGSLLKAFVNGTRQVLAVQVFVSVLAIALAGWTLAVTNDLIRERNRLRDRVIQLEQNMASQGIVVPATPALVDQPVIVSAGTAYPGAIGSERAAAGKDAATDERDLREVVTGLFAPPPPLRLVVLHVREARDGPTANGIADVLRENGMAVDVALMQARDPRPPGYTYFEGRQSRAAADLVSQFQEIARAQSIAAWSAQLRGTALPAQGEYTTDRVDIVLPPTPAPPPPPPTIAATPTPQP